MLMSSTDRSANRMIRMICRYNVELMFVGSDCRTSDRVSDRSMDERIIGLGTAKRGLTARYLVSTDGY